jgi:hypothetical protein
MTTEKTITLYKFDELPTEQAKDRTREWYRSVIDYDWYECIYADAERIGLKITEFDLGGRKHIKGHLLVSAQECCTQILNEHGESCDTYTLATQWLAKSDKLTALLEAACDDEADEERDRLEAEQEEQEAEFEHALLEEYFTLLDHEWDYINSDEQVDESIRANEYTFTEDGRREN